MRYYRAVLTVTGGMSFGGDRLRRSDNCAVDLLLLVAVRYPYLREKKSSFVQQKHLRQPRMKSVTTPVHHYCASLRRTFLYGTLLVTVLSRHRHPKFNTRSSSCRGMFSDHLTI